MEMDNKIREIAEKIHREGLEKANQEAEQIINEAKKESERILAGARKEAEKILNNAGKEAEEFSEKIQSEIRIAHRQALEGLKLEITGLIQDNVISAPVRSGLEDKTFFLKLLETVVENWKDHSQDAALEVLLPSDQLESAENHFRSKVKELLDSGLAFKPVPGLSNGFEIRPKNGGYKISMTGEALVEFLSTYFRSKTRDFLFGAEDK